MRKRPIILILFFILYSKLYSESSGVIFLSNYNDGFKLAVSKHKALLLDFYADWCAPCKTMDSEVLNEPVLSRFFNSNFISIKINGESNKGKKLMKEYMVSGFPTYIFINRNGKQVNRISGYVESSQFLQMGRETVDSNYSLKNLRNHFINDPESRKKTILLLESLSSDDISEISGIMDYHHFRKKNINTENLYNDIKKFSPLNNSKSIKYMRSNLSKFYKYQSKEDLENWLKINSFKSMLQAKKELDEKSFFEARNDYGIPVDRAEKLRMDVLLLDFYGNFDLEKFRITARIMIQENWIKDWEALHLISEQFLLKTNRKEDLEEGLKIAEVSVNLDENASNLDTKALLLNKIGNKKEAILIAEKVRDIYSKNPDAYKAIELKSFQLLGSSFLNRTN